MEIYSILATSQTPLVLMNHSNGTVEIRGRSIPDEAEPFWGPILAWFEKYAVSPQPETHVSIDLEYFNIASSKRILFLLYKLNEMVEKGFSARVTWCYKEADEDMFEVGQDYSFMVKVPFEFKEYTEAGSVRIS